MLDRNIEDTRQPDESHYVDYGFECQKCGKKELTIDETLTVITYPHGINGGMVDKTVCEECHYNITKYGWYFEDNEEYIRDNSPEEVSPEGDLFDIVKNHVENE